MTRVPESMRRADKHLRPIIEERLRQFDEYGKDWSDKPVSSGCYLLIDKLWVFSLKIIISLERPIDLAN